MASDVSIRIVIDGINNASATIQQVSKELDSAGEAAKRADLGMQQLAGSLQQIGLYAAGIGAAFAGAFGVATKAAGEFELGLARVQAVVQADIKDTGELQSAMSAVRAEAVKLGQDTQFSSTQATGAMKELAQAGYNTAQIIQSTGPVLNMAAAAEISMADAAGILVNILNPFNLGADKAAKTANELTIAANATTTNIAELGHAMAYAAPAANAVGMSVGETAAALGILSDAGIKASMAGTTLRGILVALVNPTEKAKETLANLHVEVVKDEQGNVKLAETMAALKGANMSLSDAVQIFNRHVAAGALAIADKNVKLSDLIEKVKNSDGALDKFKDTIEKNLLTALTKLGASLTQLAIDMASPLLGPLTRIVNAFMEVVNWIDKVVNAVPILAGGFMAVIGTLGLVLIPLGLLTAAFGTFIMLLESATRASEVLAVAKTQLSATAGRLAAAVGIETAAVAASTVAIEGNVAALAGSNVAHATSESLVNRLSASWASIGPVVTRIAGMLAGIGLATSDSLRATDKDFKDLNKDLEGINKEAGQFIALAAMIGGTAGALLAALAAWAAVTVQLSVNGKELFEWLSKDESILGSIMRTLMQFATPIIAILKLLGLWKDEQDKVSDATKKTDGIIRTGKDAMDAAAKAALSLAENAAKSGQSFKDFSAEYEKINKAKPPDEIVHVFLQARLAAQGLTASYQEANHAQKEFAREAATAGVSLGEFSKSFKAAFNRDVPEDVGKIYGKMFADIQGGAQGMTRDIESTKGVTKDLEKASGQSKEQLTQWVQEAKELADHIKGSMGVLKDELKEKFSTTSSSLKKLADDWKSTYKDIDQGLEVADGKFAGFADSMTKSLGNAADYVQGNFAQLTSALQQAVDSKQPVAQIDEIKKGIESFTKESVKGLQEMGKLAGSVFEDMKAKYDKISDEMVKLSNDFASKREKFETEADNAIYQQKLRSMNELQRNEEQLYEIEFRRSEAEALMASGSAEDQQKAIDLLSQNIKEAEKLKEVKVSYYDKLSGAEKQKFDEEMSNLKKLEDAQKIAGNSQVVMDDLEKERYQEMKRLKAEKNILITAEEAAEKNISIIQENQQLRAEALNKLEEQKRSALEAQQKQLAENMKILADYKTEIDEIVKRLTQQMKITLNLTEAESQLEELFRRRGIQVSISGGPSADQSGSGAGGFASGGPIPGWGGGDIVPAYLEPGEWVINKYAVKAASALFGGGFWSRLNAFGGAVSRVAGAPLSIVQRFASGGPVESILNSFKGIEGALEDYMKALADKARQSVASGDAFQGSWIGNPSAVLAGNYGTANAKAEAITLQWEKSAEGFQSAVAEWNKTQEKFQSYVDNKMALKLDVTVRDDGGTNTVVQRVGD